MDAFYASVEQRDNPQLRGKPVIVGGKPGSRGVVAACSYEARRHGVHSAMPCASAYRLCPDAVFLQPRFDVYRGVSRQIQALFREVTDLVEPLSLDEAFLDVTGSSRWQGSATLIAQEIRTRIRMVTGLTASAGVSYNKFLAKIASDVNKPDGLFVITPEQAQDFIDKLPVGKFFGVGKVTEARMHELGLRCGADLRGLGEEQLVRRFGKAGRFFFRASCGIDERPVNARRLRKSLSKETTFAEDTCNRDEMLSVIFKLAGQVAASLKENQLYAKSVYIKVKYGDFRQVTRSMMLAQPCQNIGSLEQELADLLTHTEAGMRPVRLLGVGVSGLIGGPEPAQADTQQQLI